MLQGHPEYQNPPTITQRHSLELRISDPMHKTLASGPVDPDPHAGSLASAEGPVDLAILVTLKKGPLAWVVSVAQSAPPPAQKDGKKRGGRQGQWAREKIYVTAF